MVCSTTCLNFRTTTMLFQISWAWWWICHKIEDYCMCMDFCGKALPLVDSRRGAQNKNPFTRNKQQLCKFSCLYVFLFISKWNAAQNTVKAKAEHGALGICTRARCELKAHLIFMTLVYKHLSSLFVDGDQTTWNEGPAFSLSWFADFPSLRAHSK